MKTLKQMLNEAGYKEYSEINPLILQSKVIQIIRVWLQQKREAYEDYDHNEHPTSILDELLEEL